MSKDSNVADATPTLVIGTTYIINVTGFTYVKEFAMLKGKTSDGVAVSVIIGDKLTFGMRDMFAIKEAAGISATYKKDRIIVKDGVSTTYQQFSLEEILF